VDEEEGGGGGGDKINKMCQFHTMEYNLVIKGT
jgi:hypothetical protein